MARRKDTTPTMESRPWAGPRQADDAMLELMRERSVAANDAWGDNHDRAEESVEFVEGLNHWPGDLRAERESLGQPCLVLNDMPIFVDRIVGEQLQNRQSIHVSPADTVAADYDFKGEKGQKFSAAAVREGIIRNIEYRSNAQAHYDRAFQHAVEGGFGWLRVFTRYASAEDFDQELVITSLRNRWSALIDTDGEQADFSDARFGFVVASMRKREFEARHPNAMVGEIGSLPERHRLFWGSEERVTVAEYMTREPTEREMILLSNGAKGFADDLVGNLRDGALVDADGLAVVGQDGAPITVKMRRPVTDWAVYWRKVTAWSVLEKQIRLPFSTIPLIPVTGRQRDMRDGTVLYSSAIHHAMDTKRMEEFWMSSATGRVALAPLAPWVGRAEAFEGFEGVWETANRQPHAYLPYGGDEAPRRADPPAMPVAELALVGSMHDRTKAAIGIFDASLGAASNETSGRAINARDRQSSTSTFVFGDNLGKAIRRVGLLLNEALPAVYDTERAMALRNEDETTDWVTINQAVPGLDGKPQVVNSLAAGQFGVVVTAGPAYVTRRQEASEAQLAVMQAAPAVIPIMLDTYALSSDWPGADKLARRARKMMDKSLLTAGELREMEEEDAEQGGQQVDPQTGQPADAPPDPQQILAQQMLEMQAQVQTRQADADMAAADAKIAEAEAKKAKAAADQMEAQMRMAALQQGGLAPQLPVVGAQTDYGQEISNA